MKKLPANPPKTGVSPELMEIALRWLRQTYGSRPLNSHVVWELEHGLGSIERSYCKPPEPETGLTKAAASNGELWRDGQ